VKTNPVNIKCFCESAVADVANPRDQWAPRVPYNCKKPSINMSFLIAAGRSRISPARRRNKNCFHERSVVNPGINGVPEYLKLQSREYFILYRSLN